MPEHIQAFQIETTGSVYSRHTWWLVLTCEPGPEIGCHTWKAAIFPGWADYKTLRDLL